MIATFRHRLGTPCSSKRLGSKRLHGSRGFFGRRDFCAEAPKQEKPTPTPTTWGEKLLAVGMLLRGAAFLPRLASAAPMLRFAGVGPMALGAVVSVYEIGGWRLVLAIPGSVAVAAGASTFTESRLEEKLKQEIITELHCNCDGLPHDASEALHGACLRQYETNFAKLIVELPAQAVGKWRIEVSCQRQCFPSAWSVVTLRVLRSAVIEGLHETLPPQTRNWRTDAPPTKWELFWERAQDTSTHVAADGLCEG
eukprot:TRINITY_DN44881_c0_g1_i1.p1 TRINITY_DN44881_c0_g1~~TRINITY_DN44881_c0_g1_i1.p1  ORF type:complete len:253 (+),score=39.15 TRINITY_DN44881_c0_g1_i1:66-824(+)